MKPLEGIRILDLTRYMSGPMCTLLLNDFGAEVIKIEYPPLGDEARYGKVIEHQASSHYAARNRGKKSIVLNMKDAEHRALFLKLVKTADAVIENFKPGTMERFGITYELLAQINPRIVYTSITGYGQDGPYSSRGAFDATVQAESGLMSITGEEGGRPLKCGGAVGDYCGGLAGCIGTLMGIVDAQRTGHGRRVDVSMMDALIFLLENHLGAYLKTGEVPRPNGNRYIVGSPIGDFMCKDGVPVMLNITTDLQWRRFAQAMEQPQWVDDPDFTSVALRTENYRKIESEVSRLFLQHSSEEICRRLEQHQCAFGRINDFEAVKNHPQVKHRGMIVEAAYSNGTVFQVPGNPIHMDGVERQREFHAASLGEDTFEVLSEVASPEELHRLFDPVMDEIRSATKEMYQKSE